MKLDDIKQQIVMYLDDAFISTLRLKKQSFEDNNYINEKFYLGKLAAFVELSEFFDGVFKELTD